jgi:pimeloyl-ACP methyl ester carboxylesterase
MLFAGMVRRRIGMLAIAAILLVFALWRPVAEHLRALSLLERFSAVSDASERAPAELSEALFPIPRTDASRGVIRGRIYTPRGPSRGAIVLVPGVHHLGIDEPRLIRFARAVCASGVIVLTPEIGALVDYRIEGASAGEIGEAAHALRQRVGTPVGIMGMSFAGGLALIAASDPRFVPDVAFVVAVGAHDDLARVARFFATNAIARPDGSIAHMTAHPYGPLVLVYDHVEDFLPTADLAASTDALRLWLWEDKDAARARLAALPADTSAKLGALFDGDIASIAPQLLAEIDAHASALRAASPHGQLAGLRAPVFLLHGAGDAVIPATETLWLARDVRDEAKGLLRDVLVSPALVHVELEEEPSWREKYALVHFMAEVLDAADRE